MASHPISAPSLVIIEGKEKGKVIQLKKGTLILGRSKGDIIIADPRVSRSHLALHWDEKQRSLAFTDLKSLNGTIHNGETVESGDLFDGDRLQIGDTIFDCQMEAAAEEKSSRKPAEKRSSRKESSLPLEMEALGPLEENAELPKEMEPKIDMPSVDEGMDAGEPAESGARFAKSKFRVGEKISLLKKPSVRAGLVVLLVLLGGYFFLGQDAGQGEVDRRLAEIARLRGAGNLETALASATLLSHDYPKNVRVLFLLAELHTIRGNSREAITAYDRIHALSPKDSRIHAKLVRLFLRTQQNDRAKIEYENLTRVLGGYVQVVNQASPAGEEIPGKVFSSYPYLRDVFIDTAHLFIEFPKLQLAPEQLSSIARALQKSIAPELNVGQKLQAQVLFRQNQVARAVAVLEDVLPMDPRDNWVIENLALAKLRLRDYGGAQRAVATWIDSYPESTKAHLIMAHLKFTEKDIEGARPYLQKILTVGSTNPRDPFYPEALHLTGLIYLQSNKPTEAKSFFEKACTLGYDSSCNNPLLKKEDASP